MLSDPNDTRADMNNTVTKPITPYTYSLVETMFVATADQNYILARWAALNELNVDFFWMSLHALEKYFKAILLYNGQSAKGYSHNIVTLHEAVLRLDSQLSFGSLKSPPTISKDALHWQAETAKSFIARLNHWGDPNNRYMAYGWVQRWPQNLIKLDQLVWRICRYCRPFAWTTNGKTVKWVQLLKKTPAEWRLNSHLPLERALAGGLTDAASEAATTLNYAFAPDGGHDIDSWRSSFANPPLADWFHLLRNATDNSTKKTARETLEWVLQNVDLGKDRSTVRSELERAVRQSKNPESRI